MCLHVPRSGEHYERWPPTVESLLYVVGVNLMFARPKLKRVAHALMAIETAMIFLAAVENGGNRGLVAAHAIGFYDSATGFFNANNLRIAKGEHVGMSDSVFRFGGEFTDEIVRHVAVVAGGKTVRRDPPRIVIVFHDVAVHARLGIIEHIGISLGINERIAADSDQHPWRHDEKRGEDSSGVHFGVSFAFKARSSGNVPPCLMTTL